MFVQDREIRSGCHPYLVAEMSANHNHDIDVAKNTIQAALNSGADAVKIQSFTPDTITMNCDDDFFKISTGPWAGKTLYELYQQASLPFEWHKELFEFANKIGITLFSSPFDKTAVDLLESLNAPAYKIASFEAVDIPLIEYVAATGKPIIISTGIANLDEIGEALTAAQSSKTKNVMLLHCVSGYPAPSSDYHLKTILDLKKTFGVEVGLSDHTLDNLTAVLSVSLGAPIIEKHFTLERGQGSPDDGFSLEPHEFASLAEDIERAFLALGDPSYSLKSSEKENAKFRRSLFFAVSKDAGEIIEENDIRSVRPGYGLPPKYLTQLIGRRLTKRSVKCKPVSWDFFE